jgi:hypothetical protein
MGRSLYNRRNLSGYNADVDLLLATTDLGTIHGGVSWFQQETTGTAAYAVNTAVAVGRDVVLNGDFASDTIWSKGTGWTIAAGVANCDGSQVGASNLTQTTLTESNLEYEVTFTISNYVAGQVRPSLGGGAGTGTFRSADGTYVETLTATSPPALALVADADFEADIDDVSMTMLNIAANTNYPVAVALVDGDMEAADTSAWAEISVATLSKETGSPISGVRTLRVEAADGDFLAGGYQDVLTVGKFYRVVGKARGDGTNGYPRITTNSMTTALWTGTLSNSTQAFEVVFRADADDLVCTVGATAGPGTKYAEFDDIVVTELNPLNGDYTGVTLGQPGPAGLNAVAYDGSNDYVNIYSAVFNSLFDPSVGTAIVFAKVSGAGVWSDGINRRWLELYVDANNYVRLTKNAADVITMQYNAGGTLENSQPSDQPTDWFMLAITWNKANDRVRFYLNGDQVGVDSTGLGVWAGNLGETTTLIGASTTAPLTVWDGSIGPVTVLTGEATAAELLKLAEVGGVT